MKVLVPVKRVPDPFARVRLTPDGRVDESGAKWVINPFDEIALEETARMRERGVALDVIAATIGPPACEEQLRVALAMGADRAVLISDDAPMDPGVVSVLLVALCNREQPDMVLMGKQAVDDDASQVGPMLAARLGLPQATFASRIELSPDGTHARVTREVDAGRETIDVRLPAVITTDLRLNEPRYIALPAIIRSRSKPLERVSAADLGAERPAGRVEVLALASPPPRKPGRRVGSVDELLAALRDEAGVI